jgi:hypothetical protein
MEENNTKGFYKNDEGQLLYGPNFVISSWYDLRKETKDQYTYPIDGWYWFDSEESARQFFNLPKPNIDNMGDFNAGNL